MNTMMKDKNMNILNGTEAFAALAAGQQIECRHVQAGEFDDIRNFPATVYFNPEFEFRIAIKFFQIGEMQVPEPIKEHPAKGAQCFLPSLLTEELSKPFKWKNSYTDLVLLGRGLVHLIQEHAETHALALITVSSGIFENTQKDTSNDVEEKPSVEESQPEKMDPDDFDEQDPAISKILDAINKCQSDYDLQGVERNLEGNKAKIHETEYVELLNRIQLKRESVLADRNTKSSSIKSDYMVQLTSASELNVIEEIAKQIESDTQLIDTHKGHLANFVQARKKVVHIEASNIVEKAEEIDAPKPTVLDESSEYQKLLNELIDRARASKTPAEANALIKYTSAWTEEQRKPLIDAIHVRLVELNPPVNNASLSVRISKAPDLTELDALEIDVSACDEFIQPKLMELVHKRRAELDPFFNPLESAS